VNSFTGATKVLLAGGKARAIDAVKAGDKVVATDPAARVTGPRAVARVIAHKGVHAMVAVTLLGGAVIHATDHHPFWDATTGAFTYASALHPGDKLLEPSGHTLPVTKIRDYTATLTAYNLAITGIHTYYVLAGTTPVLVHNTCGIPRGFASASDFESFGAKLKNGLAAAGYGNARAAFQGSSVTGVKFTTGAAFDVGRVSDYDVALGGEDIFRAAEEAGVGLRGGGMRTGPLTGEDLAQLGLAGLRQDLRGMVGRPVNFMIYRSIESAADRSPSIMVP
jgi:hypothetical protein